MSTAPFVVKGRQHGVDMSGFSVQTATTDGVTVVTVSGDVDIPQAGELQNVLAGLTGPVVVDLAECRFMGSDGLRALLEGRRLGAEREERFVLAVPPGGMVARLLGAVGGRTIFNVEPDLAGALATASTHDRRYGGERRRNPPLAA
jgi:anti-anti-sigma factor